jgi:asparagine synthase (glutamine-hydrolysing)
LLDQELIEFVQTMPASLKLRGLETKYILKKAVTGLIPDEIIHRPKQGFDVPIRRWFKHELQELVYDTLTDSRTAARGIFNQQAVAGILDEHRRGVRDQARPIWGLLMLELWHRAFIDRRPEPIFTGAKGVELDNFARGAAARAQA